MTIEGQPLVSRILRSRYIRKKLTGDVLVLEFDGAKLEITDRAEANRLVARIDEATKKRCGLLRVSLDVPIRHRRKDLKKDSP